MSEFSGKRMLITGGGAGIGAATAEHFAARGAKICVADISEEAGAAVARTLGEGHRFLKLDVTSPESWDSGMAALGDWGRLDIAFLNAGVMTRPANQPIRDDVFRWLAPKDLIKNIKVNLEGVVWGTLAVMPLMEGVAGATVLITSSAAGVDNNPLDPFYTVSKYAETGWVRAMGPNLASRGIRIAAVCPLGVATAMTPPDLKAEADAKGVKRATPKELAEAVEKIYREASSGEAWIAGVPGVGAYLHEFLPLRTVTAVDGPG